MNFKNYTNFRWILLVVFLTIKLSLFSQVDTLNNTSQNDLQLDALFDMDLQSLLEVTITSASKKAESSFDAPLSSSVLTAEEIKNSGVTTVEEAFRLIPGVVVREITNGNYDIHLRGFDNVPPGSFVFESMNTTTLVMIDGKKVYNQLNGGTFWETLPVSLTDIDRIEVVRGPSSALYGPNAASGAINIITKRNLLDKKYNVDAQIQVGNLNTKTTNATIAGQVTDKLTLRGSVNIDQRDRTQDTYWNFVKQDYTIADSLYDVTNPMKPHIVSNTKSWPNPSLSRNKLGTNIYANFIENENVTVDANIGYQKSEVQSVAMESQVTPLTTRISETTNAGLKASVHGISLTSSYLQGTQDIYKGGSPVRYDFNSTDLYLEYDWKLFNEKLLIRPGIQYQNSNYDDSKFVPANADGLKTNGLLNTNRELTTLAGSIRADYKVTDNLRVILAGRIDKYNAPNKIYPSYQAAISYKLNDKHLFRIVASKANRGPTMTQMYANLSAGTRYVGDQTLNLQTINMFEIGVRNKITSKLHSDLELFYMTGKNYSILAFDLVESYISKVNTVSYQNLNTKATQMGATLSLNYIPSEKIKIKGYVTAQQTQITDAPSNIIPTSLAQINIVYKDEKHVNTPSVYGGANFTIQPTTKVIVFTDFYYASAQTYRYITANGAVPTNFRMDLKVSYKVWKNNAVFVNARNLLNSNKNEFGFADKMKGLYLAGIDLSF